MINKKTLKIFQSKSNKDIHIIQKQQGMCESKSLFGIMIVVSFQKTLKIFQSKSNKDIHIIQKQQGMCESKSMFRIMIVVSFQSVFHLKIH